MLAITKRIAKGLHVGLELVEEDRQRIVGGFSMDDRQIRILESVIGNSVAAAHCRWIVK